MSKQENEGPVLGKIIHPDARAFRDAIHIAIAPVVAGEVLRPGQRVRIDLPNQGGGGVLARVAADDAADVVGIVDPFLTVPVYKGERFYLFLFPGTITSLRHSWTHPAFRADPPSPSVISRIRKVAQGESRSGQAGKVSSEGSEGKETRDE